MAQLQLRCHTVIIRSFVLVRAPFGLCMVRTRSLATEPIHHQIVFPPLFSRGGCSLSAGRRGDARLGVVEVHSNVATFLISQYTNLIQFGGKSDGAT